MACRARLVVGCDVQGDVARVVELRRRRIGWSVARADTLRVPISRASAADQSDRSIRPSASSFAWPTRTGVVTCLSPMDVRYERLRLVGMPEEDLRSAVFWRAVRELNCDSKTTSIDFYEVGQRAEDERQRPEVVVVAASHAAITSHIASVRSLGLSPTAIETTAGALARCIPATAICKSDDTWLIVEMHDRAATIIVVQGAVPRFIHPVSLNAVGDATDLGVELLHEINLSIHHLGERGHAVPSAGFVVGAIEQQKEIVAALNRQSTIAFRPLAECLDEPWPQLVTQVAAPTDPWLVPFGLALCGQQAAKSKTRRVNLMPREYGWRPSAHLSRKRCIGASVLALLVWICAAVIQLRHMDTTLSGMSADLTALQLEADARARLAAEHDEVFDELMRLISHHDPVPPAALIALLTHMIPDDAVLRELMIDVGSADRDDGDHTERGSVRVTLGGHASSTASLADMFGRLHGSNRFRNLRPELPQGSIDTAGPEHQFLLSMEVLPVPASALVETGP